MSSAYYDSRLVLAAAEIRKQALALSSSYHRCSGAELVLLSVVIIVIAKAAEKTTALLLLLLLALVVIIICQIVEHTAAA